MKVYLAGPWKDRDRVRDLASLLSANGHEITHDWWNYDVPDQDYSSLQQCASSDILGVCEAEVLVVLDSKVSEGKATEQGMAMALDLPIVVLHPIADFGKPFHNVFHYVESAYTHVYDESQLLEVLGVRG